MFWFGAEGEWCCFCTLPVPDGLGSRDWDLSSVCFRLDILDCVWGPCVSCLHPVVSHFWSCQGRTWRIECKKWWQSCQTSFISSIHAKGSWLKKCISLLCAPSVGGLSSTAHLEGIWLQLLKPSASENEDCFSGRDIATPTGHSLKSNEEHVEKDNLEKHWTGKTYVIHINTQFTMIIIIIRAIAKIWIGGLQYG